MSNSQPFGCKKCGYCCFYLDVIIMRIEDEKETRFYHKPCDARCPNMTPDDMCSIHDHPSYVECPCDRHNNPDYDPDIWHWGKNWRCIGPQLVEKNIYSLRPPKTPTWDELEELT